MLAAFVAAFGCTTIAGLDKDYSIVENDGIDGGSSGGAAAAGGTPPSGSGGGGGGGAAGTGGAIGAEICNNGADDDGDEKRDCFDSDCDGSSFCEGTCVDAATIACNTTHTGQSSGADGATQRIAPPEYECAPGERPGPEYTYRIENIVGEDTFVTIFGLSGDLDLFMVEVTEGEQCDAMRSCNAFGSAVAAADPEVLAFTPVSGRDYFVVVDGPAAADYSIAVQCSRRSNCRPVRAIQAGQTITATNAAGSAPNVTQSQQAYSCAGGTHGAPEAAFMFTPSESGNYEVTLTGLTASLSLFIIGAPDCDTTCLSATSFSTNSATHDEAVVFSATANTSYYIVVDGFAVSPFTLAVTHR